MKKRYVVIAGYNTLVEHKDRDVFESKYDAEQAAINQAKCGFRASIFEETIAFEPATPIRTEVK